MSLSDLLFATPWWVIVLLVAVGGWVFYIGNARLDRTLRRVGIVIVLLGIGLIFSSWLVETDKERMEKQSRQIVQAVVDRDWPRLQSLLSPQTNIPGIYNDRNQLIDGAKKTVDLIGLKTAPITSLNVTQNDTVITVDMTVLSTQESTLDRPYPSNWQFDWENHGTGWMLERIEPLASQQVSQSELLSHMAR